MGILYLYEQEKSILAWIPAPVGARHQVQESGAIPIDYSVFLLSVSQGGREVMLCIYGHS